MERVEITRPMVGICAMQVCAVDDATDAEMLEVANALNPSGTNAGWTLVFRKLDPELTIGENCLPGPCDDHPGRTHFLIFC